MGDFNTYWQMTINNYDDRDLALVRQGYPDDIRKLVYTLEEGKEGTPHVQAYIHMKRSVRLSHMKKLFPGAHFASQTSAEWRLNQHNYAQKQDDTARSASVIQNNDPLHTIEGTIRRVVNRMIEAYPEAELLEARVAVEREMVIEDYTMAKTFVSATYKTMWRQFGHAMHQCLFNQYQKQLLDELQESCAKSADTHAHTHGEEKISRPEGITNINAPRVSFKEPFDDAEADDEEGEDHEGHFDYSGSESEASTESDYSGCSQSTSQSEDSW
jgi:hypothetical protein